MAPKKTSSIYDLLKCRLVFTDEPLWFRLILYLIAAGIVIFAIWALHQWVVPILAVNKITTVNWIGLLKITRGHSP